MTNAPAFPAIVGVVERSGDRQLTIRTERPAAGVAWIAVEDCGAGAQPMLSLYLYGAAGPEVVARHEAAWRAWMDEHASDGTTGAKTA